MANPFKTKEVTGIEVTDSQLYCYICSFVTTGGTYYADTKTLVWVCPNGHSNKVDRDLD